MTKKTVNKIGGLELNKIAFVRTRYLPPSETFIYEELKNIKKFKPIVFTRKKMNLDSFPFSRIKPLPYSPIHIRRTFRRDDIKLIHARFGYAGVHLMEVKRQLRIPMITSFHGYDLPLKRNRSNVYHQKLSLLFKVGNLFTVPSRHMKRKLIRWGCPRYKINIMYSGIDLNKFTYTEREPKREDITIIAVGRLHSKKGFPYLLRAFKKVLKQWPSSQLIIVGEGGEHRKLERLISTLKLNEHVRLEGLISHSQMSKLLNQADIFCLPSITTKDGNQEGIPNAIKEAMATGLPILSTHHAGIPELITNEWEGFLVPEKDVEMLAEKMKVLIEDPQLRIQMGKRGREKIEKNFDSSKQVNRLEAIYMSLLRKGR